MLTPGSKQADRKLLFQTVSLRTLFLLITRRWGHCHVVGDSMLPTLQEGDIVIYRPINSLDASLKEGCIVITQDPLDLESIIIKRVHKKTSLGLELRGDNENNSIDSRKFGLVNYNFLCGIVEQII
ncbi:nickel-type superoxide dismutase maturation protease [Prochlorococcus sp. MIT 1307]|uniref:nickel-type superoxide dismutase maturation protease n=1 Tax=Prochlorococcus sp. MIT 1307 TaxID=3096219 RepID=UPI002A761C47|nr:nickel-type superoxide dismutase maturation protease [Prochlorococcus sp. MIT 1307]